MSALDTVRRRTDLDALRARTEPVDVLVVGGGITGVGVALDAASRGLSVVLVEHHDLAHGTSRWSSKLVHGGLRYLASARLGIAYESAVERHHLMTTIAPHLVAPLRQIVPDHGSRRTAASVRIGFRAGDMLRRTVGTPTAVLPGPTRMSAAEVVDRIPTVRRIGLRGGISGTDGRLVDDARLVVAVARTAAAHGATVLTRVRSDEITGDGARLTDTLTGDSFDVPARTVINATGVWADHLDRTIAVRPSRGTHLVLDAATLGHPTAALTVPVAGSVSRFVFAIPEQLGRVYLGLTDVDAPGAVPDVPVPDEHEIDFLLDSVNVALERSLTRADILGTFAGLRPLIDERTAPTEGGDLADVSRRHEVRVTDGKLVSVVGGKLTTYRRMAQDAVDAAIGAADLDAGRCITTDIPLVGAAGAVVPPGLPPSLIARYGSEAGKVVTTATVAEPLERIAPGIDVTRAEIEFAVRAEGALDVDDVLHRRTRIGLVAADADAARPAVTEIVDAALIAAAD
ncbi:glycerol-3-phosphate dehydrogenase/oxidase [Gordonia soli]|uniref:Glycerol-3-phosphate dehydrogenase n=1 Tax=Gordonia soli NBRC 108243 TaxID=1223545 RepID=M0QED1_9ACTN|nr:glycerol-3-phosphate dehydrogenase/oxidase [Gordonia soli]GAC66799.1 glycerol-3-phosphate dehydrogenase [Gordonia soli NBRC 108243]